MGRIPIPLSGGEPSAPEPNLERGGVEEGKGYRLLTAFRMRLPHTVHRHDDVEEIAGTDRTNDPWAARLRRL